MAPLLTLILILLAAALAPIAGVDSRQRDTRRWPEADAAQSGTGG